MIKTKNSMRSLMQALAGGSILVHNFRATPSSSVAKVSRFGAYAVSAFFLGFGILTSKKSVKTNIDGTDLVSIDDTIKTIESMPESGWRAVDRLGQHINSDTSMLFASNGQQKSHINVFITQLLLSHDRFGHDCAASIEKRIHNIFSKASGHELNTRIVNQLLGSDDNIYGEPNSTPAAYLVYDNLAQIAEAAESVGQSLQDIGLASNTIQGMRKSPAWSNLAKFAASRVNILLSNHKQHGSHQIPSDTANNWRDLLLFCKSIGVDQSAANGAAP